MMNNIQDAEKILAALGLDDLPLAEVKAVPRPLPQGWFHQFREARRELLSNLVLTAKDELSMLDLSMAEIMAMVSGEKLPESISVKFKKPPICGGAVSPENMFVCRSAFEGRMIDIFIAQQAGGEKLFYPSPAKSIYVVSMSSMNSPGGNATSDRMSDVMASDVMNAIGGGRE